MGSNRNPRATYKQTLVLMRLDTTLSQVLLYPKAHRQINPNQEPKDTNPFTTSLTANLPSWPTLTLPRHQALPKHNHQPKPKNQPQN